MIQFYCEDVDMPNLDLRKVESWLLSIAKIERKELAQINYIFCSDEYLLKINIEHLNHDYYTDIITFPLKENPIEADIFISTDRVIENATEYKQIFSQELLRVIAHGLLHLCGFDDKNEEAQNQMTSKENDCLSLWAKTT